MQTSPAPTTDHLPYVVQGDAYAPRKMNENTKHSTQKHVDGLHLLGLNGMFPAAKLQAIR
ncbi:hypothetical protein AA18895_2044 [Acetobacter ghanensis DSM 18895]|uniref:hypothetical protein n=1 Tax=Acetobacter ghanensis TaxID=431306 RepID=UPI00073EEBF6|nr:hypothetical protein [Acetobacter ghanensis]GBQ50822.1 hypothetical protein AA18895_2044 [Acetobacter ghanensis DSM 18895]